MIRILLIDGDRDDTELFVAALEKLKDSFHCDTSDSAVDALGQLQSGGLHPDIIFLDLNMPVMTGQDFLKAIKKDSLLRHIPVVVLSTASHSQAIEAAKALGAHQFIIKPHRFADLIAELRLALTK